MADVLDFQKHQYAFAAHIRNPEVNARPQDVEERRMAIYRDLFFNNISSFLGGTFPVLKEITPKTRWDELIREFLIKHQAHTPLFLEMPEEFLSFLQNEYESQTKDYPFMVELAHYEWVELALSVEEAEIDLDGVNVNGDLMENPPVLSPVAWSLAYTFPVHQIGPDYLPETPGEQPTFLVVYRNQKDKVGFLAINAVTARLLELLSENRDMRGRDLLKNIAQELNHPRPDVVIEGGVQTLKQLWRHDIILGTRQQ